MKPLSNWSIEDVENEFGLRATVDFEQGDCREFFNRNISVVYKDDTLSGEVDFFLAQGHHSPKQPFFFLHEYKKERSALSGHLSYFVQFHSY